MDRGSGIETGRRTGNRWRPTLRQAARRGAERIGAVRPGAGRTAVGRTAVGRTGADRTAVGRWETGRMELLVVLLIAATGVAAAGVVTLLPWHPRSGLGRNDTSAVIRLDSPPVERGHPGVRPHRR